MVISYTVCFLLVWAFLFSLSIFPDPGGGPHFLAGNFPSTFPCSNIFGLFVQVFQIFSECRQAGGPFHFLVSAHLSHVFGLTFGEVSPSVCYIVYLFQLYWWWCTGFVWLPACFEIGGFHGGFVSVLFVLAWTFRGSYCGLAAPVFLNQWYSLRRYIFHFWFLERFTFLQGSCDLTFV